ncbi:hypothetical protein MCOR11_003237 [Pyricularia oryzae]|nr:hypothetical protein MCOR11_003237 [Pyricularia oryzae]
MPGQAAPCVDAAALVPVLAMQAVVKNAPLEGLERAHILSSEEWSRAFRVL